MIVKFDSTKDAGDRVVELKVGGEALDEAKIYKLVSNDFLAAGGDDYSMFTDKEVIAEYSALDDVLIQYIQENRFGAANTDQRIEDINIESSLNVFELPFVA